MAKRAKLTDDVEIVHEEKSIDARDLRRVVDEINRYKEQASEASGFAGQSTKNAVDNYGLDRQALTWSRKLDALETAKRHSTITSLLDYCSKLGMFDQGSLFDGPVAKMAEIVNRYHNAAPPPSGDADLNERLVN